MMKISGLAVATALCGSAWAGCSQASQSSSSPDSGGAVGASSGGGDAAMNDDGPASVDGAGAGDGGARGDGAAGGDGEAGAVADCGVPEASLFGLQCPVSCSGYCCDITWTQQCAAQGGWMTYCVSGGGCQGLSGTCYPPPAMDAGSFRCGPAACTRGQSCVVHQLSGDGCESEYCSNSVIPCDDAGTCVCPDAGAYASISSQLRGCSNDDAGNATVQLLY